MIKLLLTFSLLFSLTSCEKFVSSVDDSYSEVLNSKNSKLSIIFSHNINGETHPCGCRNHPLGGIPQVAGAIAEVKKNSDIIYVDTGDTFFPSTSVPNIVRKSQEYSAYKLLEYLNKVELKLFVPGDQDLALGMPFLEDLAKKAKFEILVTNSEQKKLKHIKKKIFRWKNRDIVFLGVSNPSLFNKSYFTDLKAAISKELSEIEKLKLDNSTIILLSHSGIDEDERIAKLFPQINWIIGAHSQSFLRYSKDVGKTQLVQVLSRNHYLGRIELDEKSDKNDKYEVIEIREELASKITPNPWIGWLDSLKVERDKIQAQEQDEMIVDSSDDNKLATTYNGCMECHQDQTKFWSKTAHSLAFVTLKNANASNNPACIGCHSLNYKQPDGFYNKKGLVVSEKKEMQEYWKKWENQIKGIKSVRSLSNDQREVESAKWHKLDSEFKVKHNFANVQCLNCHTQAADHPFEFEDSPKQTQAQYIQKCASCHTRDQSPEWYNKDDKGLATSINTEYFAKQIKTIACPKLSDE